MTDNIKKICIAGIGNPIRSDDGIGVYVCERIELLKIPGVSVMPLQQLQVELIETFSSFDYVVIADASIDDHDIEFYPLTSTASHSISSSHHINPEILNALSAQINGKRFHLFICKIKGVKFDFGEDLSQDAMLHADKAINIITQWISAL